MEQLATLLTINLILLSAITLAFLLVLILVLLMLRKTLMRVQVAVNEVEGAAQETRASIKHIFSDLEGFINAFMSMFKLLRRKKKNDQNA